MSSKTIRFMPADILIQVKDEASVLEVALKNAVEISHSCGGMGSCTTCRVIIEKCDEALPPRNELESEIAEPRGFADNERLSCQLEPLRGLVVRVPEALIPDLPST